MTVAPKVAIAPLSHPSVPLPIRYVDCLVVLAFLPFALLASLPVLGAVAGVTVWLVQRAIGVAIDNYAARQDDFRRATGLTFAGGMLRPLLMGLTILAIGKVGEREDGLTAALVVLVAFTIYLAMSFILRPQRKTSP